MGATAISALAATPGWPLWALFAFAMAFGATAVGWNGVFLAEIARLAPPGRISDATGGSAFFTFLGVVVTPPLFHLVLRPHVVLRIDLRVVRRAGARRRACACSSPLKSRAMPRIPEWHLFPRVSTFSA